MSEKLIREKAEIRYPGYVIGSLSVLHEVMLPKSKGVNTENRINDFRSAIRKAREELSRELEILQGAHQQFRREALNVLNTHLETLKDREFIGEMEKLIKEGVDPIAALRKVFSFYEKLIAGAGSEQIREKTVDLQDIAIRLKNQLGYRKTTTLPKGTVIVWAEQLRPGQILDLKRLGIQGLILKELSPASHEQILISALQIPTLIAPGINPSIPVGESREAILDCIEGEVIIYPDSSEKEDYRNRFSDFQNRRLNLEKEAVDSVNFGESRVNFGINLQVPDELKLVNADTIDGVGLFRTEFLLIEKERLLNEDEQVEIYKQLLGFFSDKYVNIRLFDLRPDKSIQSITSEVSFNEHEGSIRFLLHEKSILESQLKALLRALTETSHRAMTVIIPLVSIYEEVEEIHSLIDRLCSDEGLHRPSLGIMLETPAAVDLIPEIDTLVQSYSVGSNDLLQYLTATDRDAPALRHIYDFYHDSHLNTLERIRQMTAKPVTICGESAADFSFLPALAACGYTDFSLSPAKVPEAKKIMKKLAAMNLSDWYHGIRSKNRIRERRQSADSFLRELMYET